MSDDDETFDNQSKHFCKDAKGEQVSEDQENKAFEKLYMYMHAKRWNKGEWNEKYDECVKRGLTEQEAKQKANNKLETTNIKQFICM